MVVLMVCLRFFILMLSLRCVECLRRFCFMVIIWCGILMGRRDVKVGSIRVL